MLSISFIKGNGEYYENLAQTDYYSKVGEPPGKWLGSGAVDLGYFDRTLSKRSLSNLLNGFSTDGREKLVQNAGSKKRQKGYDFTFSAPKDVSVVWAAAPDWMRTEIQQAQDEAVTAALGFLENNATFTRRGKAGVFDEKAKLIAAAYEHSTSRAEDPQLHTHCLIFNVCVRDDGTDIEPVVVFRNQTSEPFLVESISSSCGCMKPSWAERR